MADSVASGGSSEGNIALGLLLAVGLFIPHWFLMLFLFGALAAGLNGLLWMLIAPPITQFFYVLPIWWSLHARKPDTARGLIIAACVIALLYGACSASIR